MTSQTKLISRIARELRYRPLYELIGRDVLIRQPDSILSDLYNALGDSLPPECKYDSPERHFLEGAMAKYGLVDVCLLAPPLLLDSCPVVEFLCSGNLDLFLSQRSRRDCLAVMTRLA